MSRFNEFSYRQAIESDNDDSDSSDFELEMEDENIVANEEASSENDSSLLQSSSRSSTSNSNGTESSHRELSKQQVMDLIQRKQIYLPYGDKFTKKPLQYGKFLILLGRCHILVFNMQTLQSKMLH